MSSIARSLALSAAIALVVAVGACDDARSAEEAAPARPDVARDVASPDPDGAPGSQPDAADADTSIPTDVAAAGDAVADSATDPGDSALDTPAPDVARTPVEHVVVPGAETLPAAFADAAATGGTGRRVVYPADGTLMPRNVAAPTFQWEGPEGGRYRLTLATSSRIYEVYTSDWRWHPSDAIWENIAAAAFDEPVVTHVAELDGTGAITRGPEVGFSLSAASVEGAVYYWAPSQSGIVRLPMGETSPELFLSGTVFNCVGCHALSPDGSRLAYTRSAGGTPIGTLGIIGTDDAREQFVPEGGLGLYYPSFAPDNVRVAAGRNGEIVVLDSDTGDIVETVPRPEGTSANFPTWSPRDDAMVFAAGDRSMMDSLGVSRAGLVRVRRNSLGWGDPEWLVERGAAGGLPENLYYPAYSPDARWIVFNRSQGDAAIGGSPEDSALWLVSAERGTPLRLDAANGPDAVTNSWPRWAPASADGTLWIAFTSNRAYGRIVSGNPQIWIAGVNPGWAAPGHDPSAAAFWMPAQDPGASNHVAYWAEYVKE